MSMEKAYMIREAHTRCITAVGFNPARRELVIGCEDGIVKSFEMESGKFVGTFSEHKGWVTDFVFWSENKVMLSSANDGDVLAWGVSGTVTDRIKIGMPVFCMALLLPRRQLLCGVNSAIRVYALDEDRESGHVVNDKILYQAREHTDIVRCIVCQDSKVFSGGYDDRLIIYDCSNRKKRMDVVSNHRAHSAGITCLAVSNDIDNPWVLTGSFDKSLKIWTLDGSLMQTMDNFPGTVTGVIYIPRVKTVWVAAAAPYAWLYEPKSGDKVSDFVGTFQNMEDEMYHLQILRYLPEISQAVATTNRRQLIMWKYNTAGCITAVKCSIPVESICYTSKVPILVFSGDQGGSISKWERNQSNPFMYSKEEITRGVKVKVVGSMDNDNKAHAHQGKGGKPPASRYAYQRHTLPSVSTHSHPLTSILRILFIESLDNIVAASENGNIYVWGFDHAAVQVLKSMQPSRLDMVVKKYGILLDEKSTLRDPKADFGEDSVTNRVAGFTSRLVLSGHEGCVTSLVTVERSFKWPSTFVLSGGWDRRVCLWDMEEGSLKTTCRTTSPNSTNVDAACDGIINGIAFSHKNSEFACASSDKMVYIRKFHMNGSRMHIVNTLQGHEGEVTAVEWNTTNNKWVTGSEDGTIRIWKGAGMNECEHVLHVNKGVTCLCIDQFLGTLVVGVDNDIRVYEPTSYSMVQSSKGHVDSVRCIIHIAERHQYVSCSWDGTIRVWNAWKLPRSKRGGAGGSKGKDDEHSAMVKKLVSQGLRGVTRRVHLTMAVNRVFNRELFPFATSDDEEPEEEEEPEEPPPKEDKWETLLGKFAKKTPPKE